MTPTGATSAACSRRTTRCCKRGTATRPVHRSLVPPPPRRAQMHHHWRHSVHEHAARPSHPERRTPRARGRLSFRQSSALRQPACAQRTHLGRLLRARRPAVMHIAAVVGHSTLAPYPLDEGDPRPPLRLPGREAARRVLRRPLRLPAARLRSRGVQDRCVAQAAGRHKRGRYRRRRRGRGRGRGRGMRLGAG